MLLPLIAPVVALRAVVCMPLIEGAPAPLVYVARRLRDGASPTALYYVLRRPTYSSIWVYGILFCFFYLVFLLWQTYYAILTVRTSAWGTRPATAGQAQQSEAPPLAASLGGTRIDLS